MPGLKLIIFDWDGTLSDSADRIVVAIHKAAEQSGLPKRSDQAVRDIIGMGLVDSFRTLYPDVEVDELTYCQAYRDAYTDPNRVAVLFDGVRETLDILRADYKLAVATGKSREGLDRELVEIGLGDYFVATRCADETAAKPNPRMVNELLSETGLQPSDAMMIGDTDHDIQTAKNAGVLAVGVLCGAQLPERINAAGPAAVLQTVVELPGWLNS